MMSNGLLTSFPMITITAKKWSGDKNGSKNKNVSGDKNVTDAYKTKSINI